ncbi:hypothetical protein Taro_021383 [Colocasia esculenta]|uniref:Uncharacterized protein n=1 Tax=Colocasia esculenta TaxID=4460 RepID=A0A843UYW8_COLES|nr:hypothetical protein [Colocasia esculenta]
MKSWRWTSTTGYGGEGFSRFYAVTKICETGVSVLEEDITMASRGRSSTQAQEDEQRREERGEQQAPAPQGPTILPPPPPMDYGVFMQGLVHAMQTQAQTQAALQAQVQAQLQFPRSMAMVVRLSWRGTVVTRKCIPSLPVCIEERGLFGCFYLLKMKDYNAILGLDWLEEHYALVDCRGNKTTFRIPRKDEFSHPLPRNLAGRFVISAMKGTKMVNKGFDAFIASVVLVPKAEQSPTLEEIEVV